MNSILYPQSGILEIENDKNGIIYRDSNLCIEVSGRLHQLTRPIANKLDQLTEKSATKISSFYIDDRPPF
ncbi:hypothetical protein EGC86_11285 [Shewanella frigidimarina]|nr:hypothetical protein EGC86_11285 [Shewanella frigidimarina]